MKAIFRTKIFYVSIVIVLLALGFAYMQSDDAEKKETMTDAEFYAALGKGKVTSLKLEPKKSVYQISGRLKDHGENFSVLVPNSEFAMDTINRAAEEHDIKQIVVIPSDIEVSEWVTVLTTTVPIILLLIMVFVIFLMVLVIKKWNRTRY
ncbi:ATP-dependent metallopeptidase FtsH/Yme1/Tma family protein [Peribacillus sp. SI8-4]|uniref:ATP-dependent metallopeptidase FtsH/Yme1/Tma family protein n=1 Tax=Peribacillus sp. SI8-4 TaxID=3048009 RepID=UPI0025571EF1|nr:ATP-dependent metallopeptidase FtsH/Yme1/Tma family protein [Peribacillus sp. SI8-4]